MIVLWTIPNKKQLCVLLYSEFGLQTEQIVEKLITTVESLLGPPSSATTVRVYESLCSLSNSPVTIIRPCGANNNFIILQNPCREMNKIFARLNKIRMIFTNVRQSSGFGHLVYSQQAWFFSVKLVKETHSKPMLIFPTI